MNPSSTPSKSSADERPHSSLKKRLLVTAVIAVTIITVLSQFGTWILWKGILEQALGLTKAAVADFEMAAKINPNSEDALMKAASLLEDEGNVTAADGYFKQLYSLPRGKLPASIHLTSIALSNKNYTDALQYAQTWISLDAKDSRAYRAKGLALLGLQREQDALECFNQSIKLDPGSEANQDRDSIMTRYKSLEDATAKIMDPKLENNPNDIHAQLRDAQRLFAVDDHEGAVGKLTQALKLRDDASVYAMRAAINFSTKHYQDAAADYAHVEQLAGNTTVVLSDIIPEYGRFANMNNLPTSLTPADVRYYHAVALSNIHDYNDALKYINKAIALRPEFARAFTARADIYHCLNKGSAEQLDRARAKKFMGKEPVNRLHDMLEKALY
ncbi:MAG TPA: tetratricopeptide repeat protein [Planktothrix sp.]|jgi:tetratricopeptide (TPR) repeat protein